MTSTAGENSEILRNTRLAFVGKLASMSRRDAGQLARSHGATVLERPDASTQLVVVGEEDLPLAEGEGPEHWFDDLEVITETQLWHRLGLVEHQQDVHRLYTPAMLADLLGVSVAVIPCITGFTSSRCDGFGTRSRCKCLSAAVWRALE